MSNISRRTYPTPPQILVKCNHIYCNCYLYYHNCCWEPWTTQTTGGVGARDSYSLHLKGNITNLHMENIFLLRVKVPGCDDISMSCVCTTCCIYITTVADTIISPDKFLHEHGTHVGAQSCIFGHGWVCGITRPTTTLTSDAFTCQQFKSPHLSQNYTRLI